MKWLDKIDRNALKNGVLAIFEHGDEPLALSYQDLKEIITAVQNGIVDEHGIPYFIHTLEFSQADFSVSAKKFQSFIHDLLQIPHLVSLSFYSEAYVMPELNIRQVKALAEEVSKSQFLRQLAVSVVKGDARTRIYKTMGQYLAFMISHSPSLQDFSCNFEDEASDYVLVKAALASTNSLQYLELPLTDMPAQLPPIINKKLTIFFDNDYELEAEQQPILFGDLDMQEARIREARMRYNLQLLPPPAASSALKRGRHEAGIPVDAGTERPTKQGKR